MQPASGAGEVTLAVWLGGVTSFGMELGASGVSGSGRTFHAARCSGHQHRQEPRQERASGPATARRDRRRLHALTARRASLDNVWQQTLAQALGGNRGGMKKESAAPNSPLCPVTRFTCTPTPAQPIFLADCRFQLCIGHRPLRPRHWMLRDLVVAAAAVPARLVLGARRVNGEVGAFDLACVKLIRQARSL